MIGPSPDYLDEIVVVLRPRLSTSRGDKRDAQVDRYDAQIYAAPSVSLPFLSTREGPPLGELPLRGVESVKVVWKVFREFLESFHDGEKAAYHMRERLFEATSPGLIKLLEMSPPRRTRIWWSCESPEIEELPWELMLVLRSTDVSLVRGLPATPRALVPRRGSNLRLAVIAKGASDVAALALDKPIDGVELAFVSGGKPVRQAIGEAMREGVELLHIVADGSTLSSWDSILEFEGDEPLAPSELCTRVRGSRVVALGLSPASMHDSGEHGPGLYRAFSHVPGAIDTTNVVAQLGPWDHHGNPLFAMLYGEIAKTNSVEAATRMVRKATSNIAPLAVYLRQRLGRELTAHTTRGPNVNMQQQEPQHVQTHVDVARDLMEQLQAIENRYPNQLQAPLSGSKAFQKQQQNLNELDADLAPWTKLQDDEQ